MTESLTLIKPDDWHLHLRDGAMLRGVLPESARHFGRAIIMPNLVPPVATRAQANAYRGRIEEALAGAGGLRPLMTLYLTEESDPADIAAAHDSGDAIAVKLYPAGATTNSASGVRDITRVHGVLERMEAIGMPLCIHGEVTDPAIDIFDREAVFIETVLDPLRRRFPALKVVLEHVTTGDGVAYVREGGETIAATLTVHHLMINRNALFAGGVRPHMYCLPVAKRERHRQALVEAATGGENRFFLGTDSAPHSIAAKESACGCAGIFTAPVALACLAQVFEAQGALDRLEGFVSKFGPAFYGLPVNRESLTMVRREKPVQLPKRVETGDGPVSVFEPPVPIHWEAVGG